MSAVCGVEARTAQNVREKQGALKSGKQLRRDIRRATGGSVVIDGKYYSFIFDIMGEDFAFVLKQYCIDINFFYF